VRALTRSFLDERLTLIHILAGIVSATHLNQYHVDFIHLYFSEDTPSIAAGSDGDEFGIGSVSPAINSNLGVLAGSLPGKSLKAKDRVATGIARTNHAGNCKHMSRRRRREKTGIHSNLLAGRAPGKLRLRDMNLTWVQRRNLQLQSSGLGGDDVNGLAPGAVVMRRTSGSIVLLKTPPLLSLGIKSSLYPFSQR